MAEELQHLIERIQREAVDTGEQQAGKIVAQARDKAAAMVKEAEVKAAAILEKAQKDSEQFTQRGQQALAQSSRDLLITVGQGVEKIFQQLVTQSVDQALSGSDLQHILTRVVEAYLKEGSHGQPLEVLLSKADKSALEGFFRQRFAEALGKGLELNADARLVKGFKVRLREKHIEHDFSRESIAEAVSVFLRPILAETVYKIAREQK